MFGIYEEMDKNNDTRVFEFTHKSLLQLKTESEEFEQLFIHFDSI